MKLGANLNARNKDGETPIFTTVDNDVKLLIIEHGADLTVRNSKGKAVMETAKEKGPQRQETLRITTLAPPVFLYALLLTVGVSSIVIASAICRMLRHNSITEHACDQSAAPAF